jgi:hypothetical protein
MDIKKTVITFIAALFGTEVVAYIMYTLDSEKDTSFFYNAAFIAVMITVLAYYSNKSKNK